MKKPILIDLFSGCGGLSIGLEEAGYSLKVAVDTDKDAIDTLNTYHKSNPGIVSDVMDSISEIKKRYEIGEIDLLAGGPPCQGFCNVNPKSNENDPRNSCVDMFLNAISILKPKQVLIENVTSLISQAKGKALLKICNFFDENGYKHKFKVLQSAHYGVPQSRWRLIIIASKIKIPIMPEPTFRAKIVPNFSRGKELTFDTNWEDDLLFSLKNHSTVGDAISDLPELENGGTYVSQEYTNSPKTDLQKILRANMIN